MMKSILLMDKDIRHSLQSGDVYFLILMEINKDI